ncbi:MAG: hypothetical protein ACO1OQ_14040 [Rufibacter sp.]
MSSTHNSLTAHLVVDDTYADTQLMHIREELAHHHGLQHVTVQVERGADSQACEQAGVYH